MQLITLILIGLGLSFDTLAVSVSTGLMVKRIMFLQAVRVAIILAVVQTLMPFFGWLGGSQIRSYIIEYDHWIAFVLLFLLGSRMIYESFQDEEENKEKDPLKFFALLSLGIASSIDALVVGFSFAFTGINIILSVLIIGSVTFLVAMLGMLFGKTAGGKFGKKMEVFGGVILILIGTKILFQHLSISIF